MTVTDILRIGLSRKELEQLEENGEYTVNRKGRDRVIEIEILDHADLEDREVF